MAVILPGKSEKSEFVNCNYPVNMAKTVASSGLLAGFFWSELAGRI